MVSELRPRGIGEILDSAVVLYRARFTKLARVAALFGHALRGAARLSGAEPITLDDKAGSFDELKALIAKTLDYLRSVDAKKMDGAADRDITFPVGDRKQTMKGGDYLAHFSMPNFYFHVTTAYDILRNNGLEIGKADFMGDT